MVYTTVQTLKKYVVGALLVCAITVGLLRVILCHYGWDTASIVTIPIFINLCAITCIVYSLYTRSNQPCTRKEITTDTMCMGFGIALFLLSFGDLFSSIKHLSVVFSLCPWILGVSCIVVTLYRYLRVNEFIVTKTPVIVYTIFAIANALSITTYHREYKVDVSIILLGYVLIVLCIAAMYGTTCVLQKNAQRSLMKVPVIDSALIVCGSHLYFVAKNLFLFWRFSGMTHSISSSHIELVMNEISIFLECIGAIVYSTPYIIEYYKTTDKIIHL